MSEAKNVETLRAFWGQWSDEGWTIEEWRHGEADLSLLDPEVVYEDNNLPDHIGDTYRGPEGVIRAAERWTEPFESLAVGLERIIDLGDELVSFHRWRARFRHTGIEINEPLAYRWRFRAGKVIYVRSLSPEEADEAASLEEAKEPTTPDLVELTRRTFAARNRHGLDAVMSLFAPDAVWEIRAGGTFMGVAAIRGVFEDYYAAYEEFEIEVEELLDFGRGIILAVNEQKARPFGSTAHVRTREAFMYEWRGGLVVRVTMYDDIDEARAAAERLAEERE